MNPPSRLREKVILSIQKEEKIRSRNYLLFLTTTIVISASSIVLLLKYLISDFSQTGFYDYLSLAISDRDVVLSHSGEFFMSLVSSVPITEITLSLAAILVLLYSLRAFVLKSSIRMVPAN